MMITISLALKTMQQLIIKPWRRSKSLWCRKKFKNSKNSKYLKNRFHYIYKLCSKILKNPRGNSVTLEAKETKKMTKKIEKNLLSQLFNFLISQVLAIFIL